MQITYSQLAWRTFPGSRGLFLVGIILMVVLQAADSWLTFHYVGGSLVQEANPLLREIARDVTTVYVKMLGAATSGVVLWGLAVRFPQLARGTLFSVIVFYTAVILWNVAVIAA